MCYSCCCARIAHTRRELLVNRVTFILTLNEYKKKRSTANSLIHLRESVLLDREFKGYVN